MEDRKESMSFIGVWKGYKHFDDININEEIKQNMLESFFKSKDGIKFMKDYVKDYNKKLEQLLFFFSWIFDCFDRRISIDIEKELFLFKEKNFSIEEFIDQTTKSDREKLIEYTIDRISSIKKANNVCFSDLHLLFDVFKDYILKNEFFVDLLVDYFHLEYEKNPNFTKYRTDVFWINYCSKNPLKLDIFNEFKEEILHIDHSVLLPIILETHEEAYNCY